MGTACGAPILVPRRFEASLEFLFRIDPVPIVGLNDFLPDTHQIGKGVINLVSDLTMA